MQYKMVTGDAAVTEQRFGNYRVVRKLGEGAMGVVFEAIHEEIGKRAAVKVLHSSISRDPQISARFLTEARAVNLVAHPGLVSIFEFGRTPDGTAFLVMEYLEGDTLSARIGKLRQIPPSDARRILRQMAGALAAAHEKSIVHRDLKPDNVMLVPEPELPGGERAKILDFGVAKVAQQSSGVMTQAGALLGTPAYMAPEQCLGANNVDEKADVYALGVIFYEMLTGTLPFVAEGLGEIMLMHLQQKPKPVQEVNPEVPSDLASLVMNMLTKTPAERPTAREVFRAVEAPGISAVMPTVKVRPSAFVLRATPAATVENWVYIDHQQANLNPGAMILFTPNWNPGGQGGVYNNHHTGVWFAGNGRWAIYNEDRAPMPTNAAFNVLVSQEAFIHRAASGNIINNWTLIDHPACNNRKDALLLISPNWNPSGQGGVYNNHALGVWYTQGRWSIYNADRLPMPPYAAWNVLVSEKTFCHRVTQNNLVGANGTWLEHPAARGNPDAVVIVTANWNPGGQGGLYNDHAIGVYYCGDRWAIFNEDMAPMPIGAAFNVFIA